MLNYKKPAFWIIMVAVIACVAVAVCFMTNPKDNEPDLSCLNYENACSLAADVIDVDAIYYPPTNKNEDGIISIGYVNGNELAKYLDNVSWQKWNAPQEGLSSPGSIEFCISDDYRITIYQKPHWAVVTYGDEARYYKTHGGDYEDAVKLFYTDTQKLEVTKWFDCLNCDEMIRDGVWEINLDEYPGITFRWSYEKLEAVTDKEIVPLYTGMPIWSVYFCDFNNDGKPELCSTLSIGSGIIDNRIIIYDYAKGASYNLSDRGQYDYTLNMQNGKLMVEKRRYNQDELLGSGELVYQDNTYQVMWDHESETVEAQIANPWLSFDNLISAEKHAGFERGIPETISDTYKVVSYSVLDGEKPLLHTTEPFIRSRMETDESAAADTVVFDGAKANNETDSVYFVFS